MNNLSLLFIPICGFEFVHTNRLD